LVVGIVAAGMILLFGGTLVNTVRTACRQPEVKPPPAIAVDGDVAARRLGEAVRLRTVAHEDLGQFDPGTFLDLHRLLETSYPNVHRVLSREVINRYSLLYSWKGNDAGRKPILLIAHQDVAPVEPGTEGRWTHPPFAGRIADGYVWGRGTLDDKGALLGMLEAAELLLAEGFRPARTIYLAFGHDEEARGTKGAVAIAALLRSRGVALEYVLDEGLVVGDGIIPGVARPVAMVATAQKGWLTLELGVAGSGGHASMPPPHTAIGILAAAIQRLEANPMPAAVKPPVAELFACVGPETSFARRLVFANLWLFEPLVTRQLARSPATNALIRTTTAVTVVRGGTVDNVLPTAATTLVNFRILPGESTASVAADARRIINDNRIVVRPVKGEEPTAVFTSDAASFRTVATTIRQSFPDAVVAPGLMVGRTDSVHFLDLTEAAYGFLPVRLTPGDLPRFHGTNERIAVDAYAALIRFYARLLRNSAS
jgi:carboxypeptidase PM20D1